MDRQKLGAEMTPLLRSAIIGCLIAAAAGCPAAGQLPPQKDPHGSYQALTAADSTALATTRDTVYRRRLLDLIRRARLVPTDSLARLVASIRATPDSALHRLRQKVACEGWRLAEVHGNAAQDRAIKRMIDSLRRSGFDFRGNMARMQAAAGPPARLVGPLCGFYAGRPGLPDSLNDEVVPSSPPMSRATTPAPAIIGLGAGADLTCALTRRGQVFCWGRNNVGQLGIGSADFATHPEPVRIALDVAASSLAVGYDHACVGSADGAAYCWGDDRRFETGAAGAADRCVELRREVSCRKRPTRVSGDVRFRAVAGGFRESCGVDIDRRVYCWGDAPFVGTPNYDTLTAVACGAPTAHQWCRPRPSFNRAVADTIAVGRFGDCGVTGASVHCWGRGGAVAAFVPPHDVPVGARFASVSVGAQHGCALRESGAVLCWGSRDLGALGIGARIAEPGRRAWVGAPGEAGPVAGDHHFTAVSAGGLHSCAIERSTAALYCWGANQHGQLGIGVIDADAPRDIRHGVAEPRRIASAERFALVAAGVDHTCAVTERDQILCWGAIGGVDRASPTPVRFEVR